MAPDLAHLACAGSRSATATTTLLPRRGLRLDETLKHLGAAELLPMHALDGTPDQRHFADAVASAEHLARALE